MIKVNAYAANSAASKLEKYSYHLTSIGNEEVDIKVNYCGLCHSDLSMINNEWGLSQYPLVPGHEIVGEVMALGSEVKGLKVGDKVGMGWYSQSCMQCNQCMDGKQHLCGTAEGTIVGRHGGFADVVRGHWSWTTLLPEGVDMAKAGPLFCGGITVFNPIVLSGVQPTDKVGVIGIGGLGHLALKFLKAWGCEVTAFTSNKSKTEALKKMGAHNVVDSTDSKDLERIAGSLNFILNTTNVKLDWNAYLTTLAPQGKLHTVGAVLEPMEIPAFSLIGGEKSVGGSPLGSIALTRKMLEFCVRHDIYPTVEEFKMENINEAIKHLEDGKARFRVVLKA
ncbi:NAD(P)-dependent alcohol dehydrogenase [uncultured Winogradskyella sp.]|uniref:NADPH-dependent aldehyde reductase Ahr n=1 Tax=uncultured Winogradskyella sp. TaxID=395353 RepID=UPI0030DA6697|tara:strand:+ start:25180 stop:26187 length:1008 start_codon:yes stop_codon:yes gene_type:complete